MKQLLSVLILFIFTGCVSVSLPSADLKRAKDVHFSEPKAPFKPLKESLADKAWISTATNNTISYLSNCNTNSDTSIEQMRNDSITVLDKVHIQEEKNIDYNGRVALLTNAIGEVDGIAVQIKILIFKKNNCSYTLTYSGTKKRFTKEGQFFDSFVESFKAP